LVPTRIAGRGEGLKIADDASIIEAVKAGAKTYPGSLTMAARTLGMNPEHFSFIRKLIGIKESHPALPLEDIERIEQCFKIIETNRNVGHARKIGRAVIAKYWQMNGNPLLPHMPGPRFKMKDKSIVQAVRDAMQLYPNNQHEAAKKLGLGRDNYSFIRKLILIDEDPTLPIKDREELNACFDTIELERRIVEAKGIGEPLIARYWRKRKEPHKITSQRRRRFDQTILTIRESCATLDDMALPRDLTRENVTEAVSSLTLSIERLSRLMRKLVGGAEE